jgi:proton glutamate symport protein
MSHRSLVLLALVLGLTAGTLIGSEPSAWQALLRALLEPVGTLWINALRMVVVPLVVSLLVAGVGSFADLRTAGRVGGHAFGVWLSLLVISGLIGLLLVPVLFTGLSIDTMVAASLRENAAGMAGGTSESLQRMPSYAQWIVELVPTNPVRAAADGAMLPLVIFSLAFGLATATLQEPGRRALLHFFRAAADALLVLVRWILAAAPVGVFALSLGVASRMGASVAGAIGYYLVVTAVCMVVLAAAMFLAACVAGRKRPAALARALLPAQVIGFTGRSSLASLPAQVDGAAALGLRREAATFVLPLAVATFKPHGPANWAVLAAFTGLLYGVPLGAPELLTVVVSAILLSFAVPGIPSAGMLLIAPVFVSVGLPVEAIGLLIAVDAIPDMFKTLTNVTGQFSSAVIVSRFAPADVAPEASETDPVREVAEQV